MSIYLLVYLKSLRNLFSFFHFHSMCDNCSAELLRVEINFICIYSEIVLFIHEKVLKCVSKNNIFIAYDVPNKIEYAFWNRDVRSTTPAVK